jgi:hypothetical protein
MTEHGWSRDGRLEPGIRTVESVEPMAEQSGDLTEAVFRLAGKLVSKALNRPQSSHPNSSLHSTYKQNTSNSAYGGQPQQYGAYGDTPAAATVDAAVVGEQITAKTPSISEAPQAEPILKPGQQFVHIPRL